MLLSSETKSLEECIACLAHSRENTQEAIVRYRAQGAIHESEYMTRVLTQDDFCKTREEFCKDANNSKTSGPGNEVN